MGSRIDDFDQENEDEDAKFKSKNLQAERRRRKKLSDGQLELRALVPIITNMNKANIISDAIISIEELKKSVEELSDQLLQMEGISFDEDKIKLKETDVKKQMKNLRIGPEAEVQVIHFAGTKLWMNMVFQKRRGAITKLMEAISMLGIDLTDTSMTTTDRSVLFTASAEVRIRSPQHVQEIGGGMPEKYRLESR